MSSAGRYPIRTPRAYAFDAAYATVPNWDIGRPQRAFAYLVDADLVRSPVLEVGCGTGELSMFLARRRHTVLGIDISPNAIEQARSKAHWRRIPAEFLLWDALDLGGLADAGFSFATVVDCAMFHIFSDEERDRFIEGMARVLEPGGAYFVLGDARSDPRSIYGISPGELRARFRKRAGWEVLFVYETVFERRYSTNPAYFAGVKKRER